MLPFLWNILHWLVVAIPATWTNSWLSYIQNKLTIAFRTRLTDAALQAYLGEDSETKQKIYYKLCTSPRRARVLVAETRDVRSESGRSHQEPRSVRSRRAARPWPLTV